MTKTIRINLFDPRSLDRARHKILEYRRWVLDTLNELMDVLAEFGEIEAINRVAHIDTGETLDSIHGYTHFATANKKEAIIVAGGAAVWIEFGTGIIANPVDLHPNRPPGIVGIGEYGHGQGGDTDRGWYYPTDRPELALARPNGQPVRMRSGMYLAYTRGMPQNLFMWNTAMEIARQAPAIAKEVFR